MISNNFDNQFINGQNSLTGSSQLETALLDLDINPGGGSDVQNPLLSNIDANATYTMINTREPVLPQDVATKNYVDTTTSGGLPITSTLNSIANANSTSANWTNNGYKITNV